MPKTHIIGALDIGGTKIAASIANEDGPLARLTAPTVKSGTVRALPEQAIALLESACAKAGVDPALLRSVGVSSCGPFVDLDGGIGLAAPNICGGEEGAADLPNDWKAIPLQQVLQERFAHVLIENDCVAALAAERTFGAVQGEPNCVYVTWSTGVGFGLCVDGNMLRGKGGNAGHAGHMLMSENSDAQCGCGNVGDVEGLISGRNLGNRLGKSTQDVFDAARVGDPQARELALEAARRFGRALYNVTAVLDTRVFVIGGSVWTHHGDWLAETVQQEIASRLPAITRGVRIMPAMLQGLVADVGAFSLAMPREWIPGWRATQPWKSLAD
jgi:glucokinase